MRILVLRGGALGDFIVTLPALGLLRRRWPGARLELVGNTRAAAVALDRHYLDAAHSQDDARWSRLGTGALAPGDELARWLGAFDLVVNYWPDPDGGIAADFARLGFAAPRPDRPGELARRFLSLPPVPSRAPAAAHFCAALAPLGLAANAADLCARVYPNIGDRAAATALLPGDGPPLLAWHPGSGSPAKNWPLERWLYVLDGLAAGRRFRPIAILGEAELAWWDAVAAPPLPAGSLVLRGTAPTVLAALFERCALFLGHDTGPAHLAAAAGCPCVLVFGPTDPAMWAPPHAWVTAVRRGPNTNAAGVDDVLAAAGARLAAGRPPR